MNIKYHPQVQYATGGPWCRPSVGNIDGGYDTPEEVEQLFIVLRKFDAEYYAHVKFRVIKVTIEIVKEL